MSASYNFDAIAASGTNYISAVRFIIQDIPATPTSSGTDVELQDEEITALFNTTSTGYGTGTGVEEQCAYATALECAKALHRRYSKQATFSSAGTRVELNERAQYWLNTVQDIAMKLATLSYNGSLFAVVGRNPSYLDERTLNNHSFTIDTW